MEMPWLALSFETGVLLALIIALRLLGHVLAQQRRFLLRLKPFETRVAQAGPATVPAGSLAATFDQFVRGEPAPDLRVTDGAGHLVPLVSLLRSGKPVMLVFAASEGAQHSAFSSDLVRWQHDYQSLFTLVVVSGRKQDQLISSTMNQDDEGRTASQRSSLPSAVLILASGILGSSLVQGMEAIRNLIIETLARTLHELAPLPTSPARSEGKRLGLMKPTVSEEEIELTIGMATYDDYNGVYFTLMALMLYQDLAHTELLVIDNYGCELTQHLLERMPRTRYLRATDVVGTSAPRDLLFREARGRAVLCCDSHVLFAPGAIARLKQFYRDHPDCLDLLQGPLVYENGNIGGTHMDPYWGTQMWGTWGRDPRGQDTEGEPFEIPMHGLGVFSCLKSAWPGFHPDFRGFGGEEGYLHEKVRQAGHTTLCLPWLRWYHRFGKPGGVPYPFRLEDRIRNYVIGHGELGLSLIPILQHFAQYLPLEQVIAITEQTRAPRWKPEETTGRERDEQVDLPPRSSHALTSTAQEHFRVVPKVSYLICSISRSGSYLLCEALKQTGVAGRPTEYFLESTMHALQRQGGISSMSEYLGKVLELGTTPNGVFGTKMHLSHFRRLLFILKGMTAGQALTEEELLATVFPNLSYIWIRRRDKVRQAISYLKAMQTNIWWLTDHPPIPAPEPTGKAPHFDFEAIDHLVEKLEGGDKGWQEYFTTHSIQPLVVIYEDLVHSYDATTRSLLLSLNIPLPEDLGILEPRMRKQADAISDEWEQRYYRLKQAQESPVSQQHG